MVQMNWAGSWNTVEGRAFIVDVRSCLDRICKLGPTETEDAEREDRGGGEQRQQQQQHLRCGPTERGRVPSGGKVGDEG
jgi:hypothetical protein